MFGLSFLSPAFLIGAMAAAVPIALHLFKRQPEPIVPFSAVRFLHHAPVEESQKRRLRELILLALRITALVLLALAFARPYLNNAGGLTAAPVRIVAVDTSFSMSAPGQFERARRLAREAVKAASANEWVGLVSFSDSADLIVPPSSDRILALAAIDRMEPGFGATRYRHALGRAVQALAQHRGHIVVVTDLQRSGWEGADQGSVPSRVSVEVADVGGPGANLAVTALRREGREAVAVVRNAGGLAQNGRARLTIDSQPAADVPFTVAGGASKEIRFAVPLPPTGVAAVTVNDSTGYAADNTRYLVLDPPQAPSVLAVTGAGAAAGDAFYVERALLATDAEGDGGRFRLTTVSTAALSKIGGSLADYSTVLLLGTRGVDQRGREALAAYVTGGGGLLVASGADVDSDVLQGILGDQVPVRVDPEAAPVATLTFAPADARHPVFRTFGDAAANLSLVRFHRVTRVRASERARVLARFSNGGVALLECPAGQGRVLLFASDLNNRWNDFPLHPTFVPFVHEITRYLSAARERPREYLVGDAPADVPRRPGVVTISDPEAGTARPAVRRIAINVDTSESDPARVTAAEFAAAITHMNETAAGQARSEARQQEDRQRLWQVALALMLATLAAEGLLATRTT
jgi:hypothetical protein